MPFYNFDTSASLYEWGNVVFILIINAGLMGLIIPVILQISFHKRLFDQQDLRKIHHSIVPRLGGTAFIPVILFSMLCAFGLNSLTETSHILSNYHQHAQELLFALCGTLLLYFTGVADDLIGVRYRNKFIIQFASGIMLAASGLWIHNLYGLFGIYSLSPIAGYMLTVLVVVFIINAINLIDGIDGLASGLCCIATLYYGILFMQHGQYAFAFLSFASLGTISTFFFYNVFGVSKRRRKIFMGDTGSMTAGMLLSILSIAACNHPLENSNCSANPFVIAFAPLIVPCFDVLRVFFHRLRTRKPAFKPDQNHIHHKLLHIGLTQHQAMIIILTASVAITAANFYGSSLMNINLLLLVNISGWTLLNIWLTATIHKKKASHTKK